MLYWITLGMEGQSYIHYNQNLRIQMGSLEPRIFYNPLCKYEKSAQVSFEIQLFECCYWYVNWLNGVHWSVLNLFGEAIEIKGATDLHVNGGTGQLLYLSRELSHWLTQTAKRRHPVVNTNQLLYPQGHVIILELTVAIQMHISIEANVVLYFAFVSPISCYDVDMVQLMWLITYKADVFVVVFFIGLSCHHHLNFAGIS